MKEMRSIIKVTLCSAILAALIQCLPPSAQATDTSVVSSATLPYTVATNPSGLQIIVDGSAYIATHTFDWTPDSSHTLSVTSPQSGTTGTRYVYSSWSDGGAETHTITAPASSTTYTASFRTQYSLTTSVNPSVAGIITPSGTNWYYRGHDVSVSSTANSGYTFNGWSEDLSGIVNPTSVTMDGPKNVVANFTPNQYTLSVNINPSGSGSVSKNPNKSTYAYGEEVTLTATANSGCIFNNWSGDASGTTNPVSLTITGSKTVTANFSVMVETISTPETPTGTSNGNVGTTYAYSTMGSSSNMGHNIQYFFDWGDGTNSGWLAVGQTSALKSWSSGGEYMVKVQARCATHTSVMSNWSFALSVYIPGQWEVVTPPDVSPNWYLEGIHFTSSNEGWAVGYDASNNRGVLLHYTNGSWTGVSSPDVSTHWELSGVYFTSPNEGWAVGYDYANFCGVLLHYLNGSWVAVPPPSVSTDWGLWDVHFTSPSEGWAVGRDFSNQIGVLLRYFNESWTAITPPYVGLNWYLNKVQFTSSNEGWAVGRDVSTKTGVLLHYINGSWPPVTTPYVVAEWGGSELILWDVYFISASEGWAVGSLTDLVSPPPQVSVQIFLHYHNGSWSSPSCYCPPIDEGAPRGELYGVHFTSPTNGWAVGKGTNQGVIRHYSDGGWDNGWEAYSFPPVSVSSSWYLNSVHFTSSSEGWAVGFDDINKKGVLLRYYPSETVSTPTTPSGPTSGTTGTSYTYTTGGSSSNLSHSVEYQFDWKGDGIDVSPWGSATQSKIWTNAGTYNVRTRARCTQDVSVASGWSPSLLVTISAPETVSTPSILSGPTSGFTGTSYSYTTGGSTSTLGHDVQYIFDWGDGTNSGWLPVGQTSASKSWSFAGTYAVKARGRCVTHMDVVSFWSGSLSVTISQGYSLTTSVNPQEGGYVSPAGTNWYNSSQSVQVLATANPGYTFTNWSGDFIGTGNPTSIAMNGSKNVVANFTQNQYTLTVNIAPTGSGLVTKVPDKTTYVYGDVVTLTATANAGYTFGNWSGDATGSSNPVTVTISGNKNVTANFTQNQYTLTVSITPSGSGSVAKNPDKASYIYGEQVTLTATANSGYIFDKWSGDATGTGNPITLTINENKTVTANFAPITLQSPSDKTSFDACSLYPPPTFSWTAGETFRSYEIQFSPDSSFSSIRAKVKTTATQVTITSSTWKRVLLTPEGSEGTVYWRVVGTRANRTKFTSEFRSIIIDTAQAVGNPNISSTSKGSPPELSWENNCNTKFKVWFGSDEQFTKKKTFAFNITNPNDNEGEFMKVLTFGQWMAVKKVVEDTSGSTIYWYVESWDGLGRYSKTDVMNFVLTE